MRYIDDLAKRGRPLPEYMEQLSRELRYRDEVNIIYPVGDPIFIHIYTREAGERPMYVIVQPASGLRLGELFDIVEEALIMLIDEKLEFKTVEEHEKLLKRLLRTVVKIRYGMPLGKYDVERKRGVVKKIYVGYETYKALEYQLVMEK
ncbi:MAG TPA: hypothetical protein ENF33_04630, partial [Nitrososphaeria archaeon]|nr:hypothetical protein [Nitrososphaeria archaeon]